MEKNFVLHNSQSLISFHVKYMVDMSRGFCFASILGIKVSSRIVDQVGMFKQLSVAV